MPKHVYIETTIVSYLTARPTRDLIQAARQELTREWWETRRGGFDTFASQLVIDEAGDGDPDAAQRRLALLEGVPLLDLTDEATVLGAALVEEGIIPAKAATDALHVAVSAVHEVDILLTWNCRHLANGEILGEIFRLVRSRGCEPPIICTPEELMGE